MKIRPFKAEDYEQVCKLLIRNKVEPPEEISDLGGLCLVAEENKEIIGCIYALIGNSTKAYIDFYTATTPFIARDLMYTLEVILRLHGIKRYDFAVEKFNEGVVDMAKRYGADQLRDLYFFRREL